MEPTPDPLDEIGMAFCHRIRTEVGEKQISNLDFIDFGARLVCFLAECTTDHRQFQEIVCQMICKTAIKYLDESDYHHGPN